MSKHLFSIVVLSLSILHTICSYGQSEQIQINPEEIGESLSFVFMSDNPVQNKHLNAKTWIAKTFGDYKSVIQFEDDNNYKLILKGHHDLPDEVIDISQLYSKINVYYTLNYTITIDSKDDRYRILFDNVSVHSKTETYILGTRNTNVDAEADRLVSEYCKPYVPDAERLERKRSELDSLNSVLSSLPRKRSRSIDKQKRGLLVEIEKREKTLAENEKSILEHKARYEAIYNAFYGLVSTFQSTVESSDDF